jgi:hypothetical protein
LRGLVRHTQLCPQVPEYRQSAAAAIRLVVVVVVRELKDDTVHQDTVQELVLVVVVVVVGGTMEEQHTAEREGVVGTRVDHTNLDFLAWVCYYCHSVHWGKHLEVRRTAAVGATHDVMEPYTVVPVLEHLPSVVEQMVTDPLGRLVDKLMAYRSASWVAAVVVMDVDNRELLQGRQPYEEAVEVAHQTCWVAVAVAVVALDNTVVFAAADEDEDVRIWIRHDRHRAYRKVRHPFGGGHH